MRISSSVLVVMVLSASFVGAAPVGRDGPLREAVSIRISTDRDGYYVGEPLELTVAVRNESDSPILGYFSEHPLEGFIEIHYRRAGEAWGRLGMPKRLSPVEPVAHQPNFMQGPKRLAPNAEVTSRVVLVFDHARGRLLLSDGGSYELKVAYSDKLAGASDSVESAPTQLQVLPARKGDDALFGRYLKDELWRMAEFDPNYAPVTRELVERAMGFVEAHETSVYAQGVGSQLLKVLEARLRHSTATARDRQLHDRLKQSRARPQ